MDKFDAKFYGTIRKAKDDTIVPEDQYAVFLVKDNAFAAILPLYLEECKRLGCDQEQLNAVTSMIARMHYWRRSNPSLCKIPDAAGEKLLDI